MDHRLTAVAILLTPSMRSINCCLLVLVFAASVSAKSWRGIIPLHSTRDDVHRELGKPVIAGEAIELYESDAGHVHVRYARAACEKGLPADWGNWKVSKDTVVNISITLNDDLKVTDLKIRNLNRLKWYTDKSGATYYRDAVRGIEYQVEGDLVTAITYGPASTDARLRCSKDVRLIRY
jgi:hypothetical protein